MRVIKVVHVLNMNPFSCINNSCCTVLLYILCNVEMHVREYLLESYCLLQTPFRCDHVNTVMSSITRVVWNIAILIKRLLAKI